MIIDFYKRNRTIIDKTVFIAGMLLFVFVFVKFLFNYIAPFFIAFALSLAFEPLVILLNKKLRIHRGIAALVCVLLLVIIISTLGVTLVSKIISQTHDLSRNAYGYAQSFAELGDILQSKLGNLLGFAPDDVKTYFSNLSRTLATEASGALGGSMRSFSVWFFTHIPVTLMQLILTVVSMFFFIKDKHLIGALAAQGSPAWLTEKFAIIKRGMLRAVGGYIRAQTIVVSVIAIINITGQVLIGNKYALLVGLLVAFVDMLPVFGSGTIYWPWALVCVITGDYRTAIFLIILYAVNTVARQSLEPKVLGNQIGVHPLITLMSIYISLNVFGPVGFILGPILAVTIKALLENTDPTQPDPPGLPENAAAPPLN